MSKEQHPTPPQRPNGNFGYQPVQEQKGYQPPQNSSSGGKNPPSGGSSVISPKK